VGHARARKVAAQLVEDEDYQLRYERVAGIDVAKAKADVCTRLPPAREGGRRTSRVETVAATAREVLALAGRLIADGVEGVVMESTLVIWGSNKFLLCFGSSDRRVRVRDGRPGGHLIARGPGRVLPRAAAAGGGFLRAPVRGPGAGRWFPRGGGV
jgi:hypothetical protein